MIKVVEDGYDEEAEKALIKLKNFRETVLDAEGRIVSARAAAEAQSPEGVPEEDVFNPEKIPMKIMITKPIVTDGSNAGL